MHQSWILMTGSIVLTADVAVRKTCMFWSCFVIGFGVCARQESASKNGLAMRCVGRSCCGKNKQNVLHVTCYTCQFSDRKSLSFGPVDLQRKASIPLAARLPEMSSNMGAIRLWVSCYFHTWMFLRLERFWFQCQFNFGLASTLNHSPVWRSFTWQSIVCFFVLWRVVPAVPRKLTWFLFAFVEHRLWAWS